MPLPPGQPSSASNEISMQQFEQAITELTQLVERMEQGKQTLAESLSDYERGIKLANVCQHLLKQAQQKVQLLTEENELVTLSTDTKNSTEVDTD